MPNDNQNRPELIKEYLKLRQKVGELETYKNESGKVREVLTKFKALFSGIADLAYICDTRGNIVYVNDAFESMTGHRSEDFIGKPFAQLFDPRNLKKAFQAYSRTLGGESPVYELTFRDTGVVCEYKNAPMRDECGKIVGVMGIARDVTEKRRLESEINRYRNRLEEVLREQTAELKNLAERLRESEAARKNALEALAGLELRYGALSELASDAVFTLDASTSRIEGASLKARALLSGGEEIAGKELSEVIPAAALDAETLLIMARSSAKKECVITPRGKEKGTLMEASAAEINPEGRAIITVVLRDVSERVTASAEVKKLYRALDLASSAVLTTDKNGIVEYVNPAFERLTGYRRIEAAGNHFRDLTEGMSCEEFDALWLSTLEGRSWTGVFKNRRKGGGYSACNATVDPVRDTRGTITHFLFVLDEINREGSDFILDLSSLNI